MMGNYHVRFLGDKGGVTRLSYPIRFLKQYQFWKIFEIDFYRILKEFLCLTEIFGSGKVDRFSGVDRAEQFEIIFKI